MLVICNTQRFLLSWLMVSADNKDATIYRSAINDKIVSYYSVYKNDVMDSMPGVSH